MLYSKTQVLNNIIFGIEYGYPHCCIKYFNVRQVNGELQKSLQTSNLKKQKLFGTGYICCPQCNLDFSEEELIENINLNRLRTNKFPNQNECELDPEKILLLDKDKITQLISDTIDSVEKFITLED